MRLNLERLESSGLDLTFGSDPARQHRIVLGRTEGLRGTLSRSQDFLRLSEVVLQSVLVRLLQLKFKTFTIALEEQGSVTEFSGSHEKLSDTTEFHFVARSLRAPALSASFEKFQLRGELRAENVQLDKKGSEGQLRVESLELDGLQFVSTAQLRAERLTAKNVAVTWGAGGFAVQVGEIQVQKGSAELDLSSLGASTDRTTQEQSSTTSESKPSYFDWDVLDGLSGSLDVDVFADVKVPVLGSRKATHPFRISIQSGAVNYMDVESNLSALEDSFLDFAVREDALVLERGIPLLPTRGQGKPLVVWPLGQSDLALAGQNRVRLAVLPLGRPAPAEEPDKADGESADSALRQLSFVEVQALLRLDPVAPSRSPIRELSIEELQVQGTVHHRAEGEPPAGELTGKLRGLRGHVTGLPLGTSTLDLGTFQLGELGQLQVPFRGVRPQKASFELADLRLTALSLGTRGSSSERRAR